MCIVIILENFEHEFSEFFDKIFIKKDIVSVLTEKEFEAFQQRVFFSFEIKSLWIFQLKVVFVQCWDHYMLAFLKLLDKPMKSGEFFSISMVEEAIVA